MAQNGGHELKILHIIQIGITQKMSMGKPNQSTKGRCTCNADNLQAAGAADRPEANDRRYQLPWAENEPFEGSDDSSSMR